MSGSSAPQFVIDPSELTVLADELTQDDFDDLLARPAEGVELRLPDDDPADDIEESKEPGWLKRIILEEGVAGYIQKKFDEHKHPRWPKGTKKAGEFMRVGDVFSTADGRQWQVVHASGHGMKIIASDFTGKSADKIDLKAEKKHAPKEGVAVGGISDPAVHAFDRMSSPVVSPYVEPGTHDESLAVPAESKISKEQWKRFGRDDQEYYLDLMDRFGAWKPSEAKSMMATVFHSYDSAVQAAVQKAYDKNKGGTGFWNQGAGQWLNLASIFTKNSSNLPTMTPEEKKARFAEYQKIKAAFDELTEVVHWDLMNRCKAPDITLFHGGGGDGKGLQKYQQEYVGGKTPIYAGFSQSYSLTAAESWGSTVLATPTAIRFVAMSYYTPTPSGSSSWGEQEIAVSARMKLDDRSVAFNSSNLGMGGTAAGNAVRKWLGPATQKQPGSGDLIEELKKIWNGEGSIPIPEEPLSLSAIGGASNAQYEPLPDKLAVEAGQMAHTLKYKSEDGSKDAAVGQLDGMGLKPGDFIEGKQGTRYVIVADAGDSSSGLRYVKIDPTSKLPDYNKSYQFHLSAGNEFYRLDGHIDIPKEKKVGFVGYTQEDYSKLVPGEKKMLKDFKVGEIFKADQVGHEGEGFKVVALAAGGQVMVESLDTGKSYNAAGLHKTPQFVAGEGSTETGWKVENEFKVGDAVVIGGSGQMLGHVVSLDEETGYPEVVTPINAAPVMYKPELLSAPPEPVGIQANSYSELHLSIEKGDKFAWMGKPYTVTTTLKSGTVKAKGTDGKVIAVKSKELFDNKAIVWRPGTYAVGEKVKAGDLAVGDLVQGGAGEKLRPYVIFGQHGNKVHLLNLETGETSLVTKNKSFPRLLDAKTIAAQAQVKADDPAPVTKLAPGFVPTFKSKPVKEFDVGESYKLPLSGTVYTVVSKEPDGSWKLHLTKEDGSEAELTIPPDVAEKADTEAAEMVPASPEQQEVKPELKGKFDESKFVPGMPQKGSDLQPGDIFKSPTGLFMQVKSVGNTNVVATNLASGKIAKIPVNKTLMKMLPKEDEPFDILTASIGDKATVGDMPPGHLFLYNGEKHVVTFEAEDGIAPGISKVHVDGSVSQTVSHVGADNDVTYFGPMPVVEHPKSEIELDAGEYAYAPGYDTYLHPKSGKHKYPLVSKMAVGTVFTDKSGKAWKVKQAGAQTVVTDGKSLYSVASHWRGKISEGEVAFIDSPELPEAKPVQDGPTLGDLKNGDFFTVPDGYMGAGGKYKVIDDAPEQGAHGDYDVITVAKVMLDGSLGAESKNAISMPVVGVEQAELPTMAKTPKTKNVSDLANGDHFVIPSQPGKVWKVTQSGPDDVEWEYAGGMNFADNEKGGGIDVGAAKYMSVTYIPNGHPLLDSLTPPSAPSPSVGAGEFENLKAGDVVKFDDGTVATVVADYNGTNVKVKSQEGGQEFGMLAHDPFTVISKADSIDTASIVKDHDFFQKLSNGDKAMYNGPGGKDLVTVTDNQIPGMGVEVTDDNDVTFHAFPGELSPPEGTKVADLPSGAVIPNKNTDGNPLYKSHPPETTFTVNHDQGGTGSFSLHASHPNKSGDSKHTVAYTSTTAQTLVVHKPADDEPLTVPEAEDTLKSMIDGEIVEFHHNGMEILKKNNVWVLSHPTWGSSKTFGDPGNAAYAAVNFGSAPTPTSEPSPGKKTVYNTHDLSIGDTYEVSYGDDHKLKYEVVATSGDGVTVKLLENTGPHLEGLTPGDRGEVKAANGFKNGIEVTPNAQSAEAQSAFDGVKPGDTVWVHGDPKTVSNITKIGGVTTALHVKMNDAGLMPTITTFPEQSHPDDPTWREEGLSLTKPPAGLVSAKDVEMDTIIANPDTGDAYLKVGPGDLDYKVVMVGKDSTLTKDVGEPIKLGANPIFKVLAGPMQTIHAADAPQPSPLDPYLHPKSGKHKYAKLHTLAPGTAFSDKKKNAYTVVGHVAAMTHFKDADGNVYAAPGEHRVKAHTQIEEAWILPDGPAKINGYGTCL